MNMFWAQYVLVWICFGLICFPICFIVLGPNRKITNKRYGIGPRHTSKRFGLVLDKEDTTYQIRRILPTKHRGFGSINHTDAHDQAPKHPENQLI